MIVATRTRPPIRTAVTTALLAALGAASWQMITPRCANRAPAVLSVAADHANTAVHVKVDGVPSHARLARLAGAFLEGAHVVGTAEVAPLIASLDPADAASLGHWVRIELPVPRAVASRFAELLVARGLAVDAFAGPVITLPVVEAHVVELPRESCPVKTPRYDELQGYLGASPAGIDAPAAWSRPGGVGQGVWFADIEGGWNTRHEDLAGIKFEHVAGRMIDEPSWQAHGTAVLGEVVGRDNELGVVGIAPGVDKVVTASIWQASVAEAIYAAQRALRPGDVLLIELQGEGPRRRYVPVEYWQDVFEVIQHATSRGVIVIEAAGNGGEDLDHKTYKGVFDRRVRDSGAIMIGAGAPARAGWTDRSRLDFSNYGTRVDVQGWGRRVATLDYGDLQDCDRTRVRHYTDQFSGTSSASPIVAGAAVLIQGIRRAAGEAPLTPQALRRLLIETGTPQVDGPHGPASQHIGPRPDLARALEQL